MIRAAIRAFGTACVLAGAQVGAQVAQAGAPTGEPAAFSDLPGFAADDLAVAFAVFRTSCVAASGGAAPSRAAVPPPPALAQACSHALRLGRTVDAATARAFFETRFTPRRVAGTAFFTGYYEPVVEGSPRRTETFTAPLLAPPTGFHGALPDRDAIEAGALDASARPLAWLREPVDVFFVQVQGSARVRFPDGATRRVGFAGRNGKPYTAIGKLLVERLHVPPAEMGMAQLRAWIRANGQAPGEPGRVLMDRNRSYVFFRFDDSLPPQAGPVGASGVSLVPLRSLAVDRALWPYGVPMYVAADLPWRRDAPEPFQRLLIAQDTGSAIVGPARADIFFGSGSEAASLAGPIRDPGQLWVLWPKGENGDGDAGGEAVR